MNIVVEVIGSSRELSQAAAAIRKEVFEEEWKCKPEGLSSHNSGERVDLIARVASSGEPVAVVTIVETTDDVLLHKRFSLPFSPIDRSARYGQLAVLKRYRGLDIPLRLILEGNRQFVKPKAIKHTWLLFDADRATFCSFCRLLGFHAGDRVHESEYGRVRVLTRKEIENGPVATNDSIDYSAVISRPHSLLDPSPVLA
jgi:hypothetical protein